MGCWLANVQNHFALIKEVIVISGDHHKNFICRRCLKSYTSKNNLRIHKPKSEKQDITTIRTSNEPHLLWKNQLHRNPLFLSIYADFEADNLINNSSIGNKTTNFHDENPVFKGYHTESELDEILQTSCYKYPSGYDNIYWFVDEVLKLEIKMKLYFKNTEKDIIITEEDQEDF